jgi:hypothetical protein
MARIRAEERPLHTEFRGEYEAYCARTCGYSQGSSSHLGITRIAAVLAETVRADGSK